jgi:hypothetical protein
MVTVIEKEIYGSSLCFWGNTRDTPDRNADDLSPYFGQTYQLDTVSGSQTVYRNRDPQSNGAFPPTPKIISKLSIEPLWTYSNINPNSVAGPGGGSPYTAFFGNVRVQPYIATQPLNNLTQNFFAFSASNDVEWKLNQWGPTAGLEEGANDIHYDDKFVLQPWEDLKVRLLNADLSGELQTLPAGNPTAIAARLGQWVDNWYNSTQPVAKIRIELDEFTPSSQYFHRASLNDIELKATEIYGNYQDITLLDFRSNSPTLNKPPFNTSSFTSFSLENLDFRSAYPWGGISTTKFMYSIMLHTEGNPPATRYIRKYVRFTGGVASDLEINGLLKDIGPLLVDKGQWLAVRLHNFESTIPTATEALTARQMPGFWLNGTIT